MAQIPHPVDCNEVPPNSFEPFEGKHLAHVTDSEMKLTKNGDGEMLKLQVEVLEGPHKGRKVFDNLNLVNKSEKAMEIAYGTLSAIGHATGVMNIADSSQVHNIPMLVTFAIDGTYTRVVSYEKASPGAPTQTQVATPAPARVPAQPAQAAATPPWKKTG